MQNSDSNHHQSNDESQPVAAHLVEPASTAGPAKSTAWWRSALIGIVALPCVAVVAFFAGMWIGGAAPRDKAATGASQDTRWTCAMHPQIDRPAPGPCPICGMALIPMEKKGGSRHPRELEMTPAAAALADIQTAPVQRKAVTHTVRMVGKVDYDETKLSYITAWVPGRLDRLYVDYTGVTVRKGDHMVYLYSPDLVLAQRDLIQTWKKYQQFGKERADPLLLATLKSTEEKLRLLGLLDKQIEEIKQRGEPSDHITIYAPAGGVVIHKNANQGMYVQTGTRIYTIADLTQVWVFLDAYESDISWLRYGQEVKLTSESYPGDTITGRVAFIDPVLNEKTRTVKVRVNVANKDQRLKPGMFVKAQVKSKLATGGKVIDPSLAGKWISPMHPEIVKDGPGKCDICGMDLVPAAELGFVTAESGAEAALVIPATAPLITGRRAVVYVKMPGRKTPTFRGRDILLGPRAGDYYIVRQGLKEGEQVVTVGAFKIDASLQIRGSPSMMSPESGETPLEVPTAFRHQLASLVDAYLKLHAAMARGKRGEMIAAAAKINTSLEGIDPGGLDERATQAWHAAHHKLSKTLRADWGKMKIGQIRTQFETVSGTMLGVVEKFGHDRPAPLRKAFCPMAFDNAGAFWLQADEKIVNPYFGGKMLHCGSFKRTYQPAGVKEGQP